jgi:hypothetical protein
MRRPTIRRWAKFCLGAAWAALAIGEAQAQPSATNGTAMTGTAPNTCTMAAPTLMASGNASLSGATQTSATVSIFNFVNTANATYKPGIAIALNFVSMCNYASNFQIETQGGAMKNTAVSAVAGSGPFITSLNYTALMLWGGQLSVLSTDGNAGTMGSQASLSGAFQGSATISISLTNPLSASPLVAGAFTDHLTVQIGAAL